MKLMTFDNYNFYLQGTIESYSTKVKKHILKLFVKEGLAQAHEQVTLECGDTTIDVIDLELEEQLKACLRENKAAVKLFEKWEFTKDYKYSALFETDDFDSLLTKISGIDTISESNEYENERLQDIFTLPVRHEVNDLIIIKFGLKYSAIHNITGKEILLKYPVLVVFHVKNHIIEFRFDSLKRSFLSERKEQTVYSDLIKELIRICSIEYGHDITSIDLSFMVQETKEKDDVRLMAQYMKLPRGGNAQLEVGKNEEYILPIIGELKELLSKHIIDLEKVPVLKEALNQFLFENEELSDYSWIEVMWENDIKTRSIRVKFIFEYRNNNYCLLQHYYNNALIGMERMNHVIKYIAEHRPIQRA